MRSKNSGYSMAELMVVMAVMGVLATVAIDTTRGTIELMRYKLALSGLHDIEDRIIAFRVQDDQPRYLMDITGSTCTVCAGNPVSSWTALGFTSRPKDPWGHDYQMDENENEFGPTDCRHDALYSAGPDGVFEGQGAGDEVSGDDIQFKLKFLADRPACP